MILSFLEKKFLSIDLGSMNIKIIEGVKKSNYVEIENFGVIPIINFKEVLASSYILEENMASIVNDFLKESGIKTKNVVFNIPTPYVFSTSFEVPYIPEKNLPQVIRFESQKQIPLSFDEIETEFRYLQSENENQAKQWLIFLAAVPKSYLKKMENIASLMKLTFSGYSMEYFNFEPLFKNKQGNFVIIDLGHSYSTLHLIKNGVIIYGEKLKLRGYDLLDSIMGLTKFSEDQVIDLISKRGLSFNPEEKELKNLSEIFLKNLGTTVKNEVIRLENNFLLRIDKIYWTGGVSILAGFQEKIVTYLSEYQQEILTPFALGRGKKFDLLEKKATIFSQSVGVLYRKLLG